MPTSTGAKADHRLPLRPAEIEALRPRRGRASSASRRAGRRPATAGRPRRWVAAVAARPAAAPRPLRRPRRRRPAARRPRCWPTPSTSASATSARRSSTPTRSRPARRTRSPVAARAGRRHGAAARSRCCSILGGNPVYTAPADLDFAERAGRRCRCASTSGLYQDETAAPVPLAPSRGALPGSLGRRPRLRRHGVDRAAADRAAVRRPLGARGAGRRSPTSPSGPATSIVRDLLAAALARGRPAGDFEAFWQTALHDGVDRRHRAAAAKPVVAARRLGRRTWSRRPRAGRRRTGDRLPPRPDASTTAASPTTAGCRSCPSRSPSSPGTTPPS